MMAKVRRVAWAWAAGEGVESVGHGRELLREGVQACWREQTVGSGRLQADGCERFHGRLWERAGRRSILVEERLAGAAFDGDGPEVGVELRLAVERRLDGGGVGPVRERREDEAALAVAGAAEEAERAVEPVDDDQNGAGVRIALRVTKARGAGGMAAPDAGADQISVLRRGSAVNARPRRASSVVAATIPGSSAPRR